MSLDFYLYSRVEHANHNITHNLAEMADALGIYKCLWRPTENGFYEAGEIIPLLEKAIKKAERYPDKYRKYDSENGWGTYKNFIPWLKEVLQSCKDYPKARIEADI